MFRPDASLGLRIARTVFVPSGPLIVTVVLASLGAFSDPVGHFVLLTSFAWFFCSLILVPALLFRAESSPGSPGDGGRGDPQEPPSPERDPGGIPLPDAEQSPERIRDHVRRKRHWLRRRSAREPARVSRRRS